MTSLLQMRYFGRLKVFEKELGGSFTQIVRRTSSQSEDLKANNGLGSSGNPQGTPLEDVPEPPGTFETIGAMGAGAGGAILVAVIGVWAVFKMAAYVAHETGRSVRADEVPPVERTQNR